MVGSLSIRRHHFAATVVIRLHTHCSSDIKGDVWTLLNVVLQLPNQEFLVFVTGGEAVSRTEQSLGVGPTVCLMVLPHTQASLVTTTLITVLQLLSYRRTCGHR